MPERGAGAAEAVRLGVLAFLNAWPVYAGLARLAAPGEPWRFVTGRGVAGGGAGGPVASPVALTAALRAGRLEVAPASSVAVRGDGRLVAAPGLSISSRGRVGSVLLFSRVPLRALEGRAVAVPANSATSIAMLRALCRAHWRVRPVLVPFPGAPRLEPMLAGADAALLIGDEALRARAAADGLVQVDLGEAWHDFCGLPAVFALWAFRRSWARARPQAFRWACGRLRAAAAAGRELVAEYAGRLAAARRLPPALVREYFSLLDYEFGAPHRRSLELLCSLAAAGRADPLPGGAARGAPEAVGR